MSDLVLVVDERKLYVHKAILAISLPVFEIKKKKVWKRLKTGGSQGLNLKFKDLRKKTNRLIDSSYHQYLKSLSGKLQENPKHFWSFYSVKSRTKRIPETVIHNNVHSSDIKSKVELFNKFFQSIYSTSSSTVDQTYPDVVNPNLLSNINITTADVEGILNYININKASGVDNTSARILRSCATELSVPLTRLFYLSLTSGVTNIMEVCSVILLQYIKVMKGILRRIIDLFPYYMFLQSVWSDWYILPCFTLSIRMAACFR